MGNRFIVDKRLIVVTVVTGIIGIILLLLLPVNENRNTLVELNASVSYDGTCFTVTNNDTLDYLNAQITINSYYTINNMNLRAGETYKLWPAEFAHVNRRRFPAGQKPRLFAINCRLIGDATGFYSVKLDYK